MIEKSFQKMKITGLGIKLKQNYEVLNCSYATDDSYQIASENIRVIEKILEEKRTKIVKDCKLIDRELSRQKKFEECKKIC